MNKHFGKFLPFAGNGVKHKSNDIENLQWELERYQLKIKELKKEIKEREREFCNYIKDEWTEEEIQEARNRALNESKIE